MRKEQFVEGEYYHIYNRGVDKRSIFSDDRSRLRFLHGLYVLNNFLDIPPSPRFDIIALEPREVLKPIEPYVEVVAGCLMPNHYHLMVMQKRDGGISKLIHKLGSSYTHYFNKRYERTGALFESTFKAKHVDRHNYAVYLTEYIHLNPLDLYRSKIGTERGGSHRTLESYQWSTLPIYLGTQSKFSLVTSSDFLEKVLDMDYESYRQLIYGMI